MVRIGASHASSAVQTRGVIGLHVPQGARSIDVEVIGEGGIQEGV